MQLKNILIPVDGSEHSRRAVEYGADLAVMTKAKIVLLQCRKTVPTFLGQPNAQEMLERLNKESEAILEPFKQYLNDKKADYTDLIVGGRPSEVVVYVAEAEKCDLIVMGTRGKSEIEGLVLGSVTHRALHAAPCPVLVVR